MGWGEVEETVNGSTRRYARGSSTVVVCVRALDDEWDKMGPATACDLVWPHGDSGGSGGGCGVHPQRRLCSHRRRRPSPKAAASAHVTAWEASRSEALCAFFIGSAPEVCGSEGSRSGMQTASGASVV